MKRHTLTLIRVACIGAGLFGSVAVRAADPVVQQQVEALETKIYQLTDKDITAVKFGPGSAKISDSDVTSLRALVGATHQDQNVEKLIVGAWSDKEYPAHRNETLDKRDRDLAKDRLDAIKKVLTDAGAKDVDTQSFAEHPGWLARTFNTQSAKLSGVGKVKDADDRVVADLGKRLRDKGGPGTAVIVVKYKDAAAAH